MRPTAVMRREFLRRAAVAAAAAAVPSALPRARADAEDARRAAPAREGAKRVFAAAFTHETNTFHPVKTTRYNYARSEPGHFDLAAWRDAGLVVVPGIAAWPAGGGAIEEKACREAMDKVAESLRAALPVDAVFLRLHGAMFAEGIGPAESVLVEELRAIVGPQIPIACTFDLHGNIPARLARAGDILVGYKTAPHTDAAQKIGRAHV